MKKTSFLLLAAALMPALAQAHQAGDFIVRAGTATVHQVKVRTMCWGWENFR